MEHGLLAAALAVLGAVLVGWNRLAALVGLVLLLPFDAALKLGPFHVYTLEAFLAGLTPVLAWQWGRDPAVRKRLFDYLTPFLPFFAVVGLSILAAEDPAAGFKQWLRWAEFGVVLALARFAVPDRRRFYVLLGVVFFSGALTSAVGLIQYFGGQDAGGAMAAMSQVSGVVRASATFGHPNQFAGFLILLLPLSFELFLENERPLWQVFMGLVTLVLGLALAVTYSRGGWLSAMLAMVLVLAYYIPRNLFRSTLLLAAFVAIIFLLPTSMTNLNARLSSLVEGKTDTAVTGRLGYQRLAVRMLAKRPWLGYGAGNYGREIAKYTDEVKGDIIYLDKHIHNMYSQIALETGLVGLAAFLGFLAVMLRRLWRGFRTVSEPRRRAMLVALGASVLAFMCHNNFDVLIIYGRGVHFALVLSLGPAFAALAEGRVRHGYASDASHATGAPS